jgi:hypothetical protein
MGFYGVPKLQISYAQIKLTRNNGKQFTTTALFLSSMVQGQQEMQDDENGFNRKCSENVSEDDGSIISHDTNNTNLADFPNLKEYHLLHHHSLNMNDDMIRNRAVHELLKFMGKYDFILSDESP